jgi:hypothetical protein
MIGGATFIPLPACNSPEIIPPTDMTAIAIFFMASL